MTCQDLSVAGKRRGFEGERSVLAFEFLRIVREMREATDGAAPTFLVLENVPGLFTSAGGRDFGALLDALGDLRPMDVAWRVLDSRFFGVAQRRRRVFVVVDFGGERCDEILALREGLRGDSPARGAKRKDVAGTLGGGSSKRGWADDTDRSTFVTEDIAFPLLSREGKGPASSADSGNIVIAHTLRADGFDASEDGTGRGTPLVPVAFNWQQGGNTALGLGLDGVPPLRVGQPLAAVIPFDERGVTSPDNRSRCDPGALMHTLHEGAGAVAIQGATGGARGQNGAGIGGDLAFSLDTTGAQGVATSCVRRLTPRETERLQAFPDDWARYGRKPDGTRYELADGPRYKCMGNAVTVSVAEWIGKRMAAAVRAARLRQEEGR